jgi:hypothetical protein
VVLRARRAEPLPVAALLTYALACDQGAAEALRVDSPSVASSLYFATEAAANQARAAFEARGHQLVGITRVTTYCLD